MAKRLCKMNRKQIAENLGEIHRLVVAPKYVCRSCTRSSAEKSSLCKPAAIPPQQCQNKPLEEQKNCGLLAEALPQQSEQKADAVRRVVERVKAKVELTKASPVEKAADVELSSVDLLNKKAIKKAKKAIKKQFKQQKKLLKLARKQGKLLKRQKKLEAGIAQSKALTRQLPQLVELQNQSSIH